MLDALCLADLSLRVSLMTEGDAGNAALEVCRENV